MTRPLYALFLNNRKVKTGDLMRLKLVAHNLTGANIPGARSHKRYLATLERLHGTRFYLGDRIDIRDLTSGAVLVSAVVGTHVNDVDTQAIVSARLATHRSALPPAPNTRGATW